jgi:hypothetical protein
LVVCMHVRVQVCVTRRTVSRSQWVLGTYPAWQAWWQCLYPRAVLTLLILTSLGEDALPNGLDVTFEVTELRRLTGSYNTMVGNNEGSMVGCGSVVVV